MIVCRSAAELKRLATVNELVARVLAELEGMVQPGVTTADLDVLAEQRLREAGAQSAFKALGSIERESEHPLAKAVVRRAEEEGVELSRPSKFEALSGVGVRIDSLAV